MTQKNNKWSARQNNGNHTIGIADRDGEKKEQCARSVGWYATYAQICIIEVPGGEEKNKGIKCLMKNYGLIFPKHKGGNGYSDTESTDSSKQGGLKWTHFKTHHN